MPTTRAPEITEGDREAMQRAIGLMLRSPERIYRREFKRQLEEAKEPWVSIGRHAARLCQCDALRLPPWQFAPCDVEVGQIDEPGWEHRATREASAILARLLAACLSRYEPDPLNALARVERVA
jgi:hypothetical protein